MSHHDESFVETVPVAVLLEINRLCVEFEKAWRDGKLPRVEDFAARMSEDARVAAIRELVAQEVDLRWAAGQSAEAEEYHQRFPLYPQAVNGAFSILKGRRRSAGQLVDTDSFVGDDISDTDHKHPPAGAQRKATSPPQEPAIPERLGRFKVERRLGRGAFGDVYLADDPELKRNVALKVPRRERFSSPEDMDIFVQEARTAAGLTHAGIVTIHDVVRDGDSLFIVQEYIEGQDLANYLKTQNSGLPAEQAVGLLISIGEALSFAHQKGFVHRDLKPANILLDARLRPRVADFGLAVHETIQRRRRGDRSGTPAYMSPEQVRGETHRLDGRSDIWSLGVILYELLTACRPFRGETRDELFDEIKHRDPTPPRQRQPQVTAELDRICLKCLNKQVTDRYSSALDLVDDLRHWSVPRASAPKAPASVKIVPKGLRSFDAGDADFFLQLLPGQRDRDGLPDSICFWKTRLEEMDTEGTFAVGLVYGPSGCGKSSLVKAGLIPHLAAHVLPVYIEATPADTEVRLLKGLRKVCPAIPADASLPEVCESLREGNWLPAGRKVVLVLDQFEQWLHAHGVEQDTQLVTALRHCDGGRLQAVVMVRDDFWMAATRFMDALDIPILQGVNFAKVDLFDVRHASKVLTQFGRAFQQLPVDSQPLSDAQEQFVSVVAEGLAQDGKVISVRLSLFAEMIKSKPWTTATLEAVGGLEGIGVNFLEETFVSRTANPKHRQHQEAARSILKVLLPELGTDIKGGMRSQADLQKAAGYQDRPSDFADLLRILDSELRLITPTDPEGKDEGRRMNDELRESDTSSFIPHPSSLGYYQLTHDYLVPSLREWLTRKQRETRKGRAELKLSERSALWNAKPENRFLPSLVEWLGIRTRTESKQWTAPQRTMMSRAFRVLGLRTGLATAAVLAFMAVGIVVWGQVLQQQEDTRIKGLVGTLLRAEPAQVPEIVKELESNQAVAAKYLSPLVSLDAKTIDEKRSQLHARLATVGRDKSLAEPVLEELLTMPTNKVAYIGSIRQQLRPYAGELTDKLRAILRDDKAEPNRRFRAALALADYIPASEAASWTEQDLQFVAGQLVSANGEFQSLLRENLRPISGRLLPDLEKIFGDAKSTDAQRLSAANAFADYAVSDIPKLSQLLAVATPEQYAVLYPLVAATPAPSMVEDFGKIAATLPPVELGSVERVPYGQRRANAAVTLLRLGEREKVLPVFDMTDDPEALTQFIFRCRDRSVRVDELLDVLKLVSNQPNDPNQPEGVSPRFSVNGASADTAIQPGANARRLMHAKYALLLALGEYKLDEIPAAQREQLLKQLGDWYRNDPGSGVHGAAGWLLRHWGQHDVARQVDQTAVPYAADREWFTLAITVTPTPRPKPKEAPTEENAAADPGAKTDPASEAAESKDEATEKQDESASPKSPPEEAKPEPPPPEALPPKTFYYTFIVFPAGDSQIGSFGDEPDRQKDEVRHGVTLTHPFALLDREITFEELIAFSPKYAGFMQQFDAKPEDAGFGADWYDSVSFCRWLSQQSGFMETDQSYADPESLDEKDYPREPNPEANWAPRDWPLELGRRGFRLPTESEWEVASRVGVTTAYGYGSDVALLDRFGWFAENSGKQVHPPREQRPGSRGVFDMQGNLSEWTHDWYGDYGEAALVDPVVQKMGSFRVLRGGSWDRAAATCRVASRFADDPSNRSNGIGFRLALSSPSAQSPEADK